MKLFELGEWSLIDHLAKTLPIGDDAYVIPQKENSLLFCCDTSVDGIHFDRDIMSFYEIGFRACACSISDIAGMGGVPLYALVALGIPKDCEFSKVTELYSGMNDIASFFNMKIVGGDTVESDKLVITISVLGETEKPITRDGSKAGDFIGVSGKLGGSKKGLQILREDRQGFENLKKRYIMAMPRVKEGLILKDMVTSMIDISDGLVMDLYHLSWASKNGMSIKKGLVPIDEGASLDDALFGSDDYELLFTFSKDVSIPGFATVIGEVINKEGVFLDGEMIEPKGYEHFRQI
ncbi:TPA: thiamine-phosphate kinase [bacterium]|nr:thiamine-phosphate kinase [bacterium]